MSKEVQVELLKSLLDGVIEIGKIVVREKPYGVVHDSCEVNMNGQKGRIVWDYIIWNELTFENEQGEKASLFTSMSDTETKEKFDLLVDKYGI